MHRSLGGIPRGLCNLYSYRIGGDQLPFFGRRRYRLTIPKRPGGQEYVKETNLADDTFTLLSLVKAGYGTIAEIEAMDSPQLLDIIEYESIIADIEHYKVEQARNGNRK